MEKIISIPEERIAVLLGKGKEMKKIIERMGDVKIEVQRGSVLVKGDSLKVMKAGEVIKAIGLGFNPYDAFELFRDDVQLAVFDIEEAIPSKAHVHRQLARVIGEGGRAKRFFEKNLGIRISITRNKVAAIGDPEKLEIFREALEKLVHGSPHAAVYRYVERRLASRLNI